MDNVIYMGQNIALGVGVLTNQILHPPRRIAVDTETISVEDKTLIGLSIATSVDDSYWFPADKPGLNLALTILRRPDITKIFHNAKFDYDVLEPYGIDMENFEDSEILAYTLNLPQSLYNLCLHLGREMELMEIPKGKNMLDMGIQWALEKCCRDTVSTMWAFEKLEPHITESYYIDKNVVHVVRDMEKGGIKLDQNCLAEFDAIVGPEMDYMKQRIWTQWSCDPASNQQVGITLAKMGWRLPYTKGKKQFKVDEAVLQTIDDPLAAAVLEYRGKAKLKSTYIDPLEGADRAFSQFNTTRVITGRLSSSKPKDKVGLNFQNLPGYFRSVFLADDYFFDLDARQVELRVVAWLAKDPIMLAAFMRGEDIHRATATQLFGVPYDVVTYEMRQLGRTINFAVLYGAGDGVIVETAKKEGATLTYQQAAELKAKYFAQFPRIAIYINESHREIARTGQVRTMYGRIRKALPSDFSDPYRTEKTMKELFNMPIQGTAVEIIKKMMARARRYPLKIQVHDELLYDGACPPPHLFDGVAPFPTPLKLSVGKDWGNLVEVKGYG